MDRTDNKTPVAQIQDVEDQSRREPTSDQSASRENVTTVGEIEESEKGWFAYFKTRDFYIVLALGYFLFFSPFPKNPQTYGPEIVLDFLWEAIFLCTRGGRREKKLMIFSQYRQVLALCLTATNTFSSLLVTHRTSIPAFQTLFNYVLLNLIYTSYTIYQYGPKKWFRLMLTDGWKCIFPFPHPLFPFGSHTIKLTPSP